MNLEQAQTYQPEQRGSNSNKPFFTFERMHAIRHTIFFAHFRHFQRACIFFALGHFELFQYRLSFIILLIGLDLFRDSLVIATGSLILWCYPKISQSICIDFVQYVVHKNIYLGIPWSLPLVRLFFGVIQKFHNRFVLISFNMLSIKTCHLGLAKGSLNKYKNPVFAINFSPNHI